MDDTFKPKDDGTADNYGKLVFGKNSSGSAQEWYILGKDDGVSGKDVYKRQVFDTALNKREHIPVLLIPLVMVGTWITHLFGGSAGREGVAVQIGATFSHELGKKFKLPDSRTLLVIGMAAGFSGLFQTPLAAIFFALELSLIHI